MSDTSNFTDLPCVKALDSIPAGRLIQITWRRPLKTLKAHSNEMIEKIVRGTVRVGVDYENMASTKEGRATGDLPSKNEGLPWGEWHAFPRYIKNTKKGSTEEVVYARLTLMPGTEMESSYSRNGFPATLEEVKGFCQASEFRKPDEEITVLTLNVDSIIRVKSGEIEVHA